MPFQKFIPSTGLLALFFATTAPAQIPLKNLIADDAGRVFSLQQTDFNGDGRTDLLVSSLAYTNWAENTTTTPTHFYRQEPIEGISAGDIPLATGDLDGDGDTDVLGTEGNQIVWLANDGQGRFSNPVSIPAESVNFLAVADLDGDGKADLLSAEGPSLVWRRNLDTGQHFSDTLILGNAVTAAIWPYDIDQDGDPDLVYFGYSNGFSKLLWRENLDGHALWSDPQVLLPEQPQLVRMADYDNDGDEDLIGIYQNRVAWWEKTDMGFSSRQFLGTINQVVYSIDVADVTGDGYPDLVAGSDHAIWLLENFGSGLVSLSKLYTAEYFRRVAFVDTDHDGDQDLVAGNWDTGALIRFENQANNNFDPEPVLLNVWAKGPSVVATGDIDGDGDQDVVAACGGDQQLSWFPNDKGHFRQKNRFAPYAYHYAALECVDMDGDGDLDVLSTDRWYENNDGKGRFDSLHIFGTQAEPLDAVAADLDLDGDPDVAVASYDDGRVSWYRNLDGKGHFGPQTLVDDLTDARSVAVIDIDHNALPDVVAITGTVADATLIYPASAPGVFASLPVTKGAAWGQVKGKAGDVDGDGSADLVVLGFYELVLLRSSNGFATEKLGSFTGGFDLCIADVDHDGDRDLVVAAYADTNFVLVYPNTDGFGHFGTGFRIIRENIWALAAGDMDGNGQTDLVMAGDGHIFWRAGSTIVSTQAPPNLLRVVRVWPNPFTDMLLFNDERDVTTPCVFELFNLAGQRLLSCVVQGSSRIAVPVLPGGLYGYRVREIRDGALIGAGRVVRK